MYATGVWIYRVPMVEGGPPWDFGSAQTPIPLCYNALPISTRLQPPASLSPDGMTLGGYAELIGGQELLAQERHRCPGTPLCLPSQSVQGSSVACSTH